MLAVAVGVVPTAQTGRCAGGWWRCRSGWCYLTSPRPDSPRRHPAPRAGSHGQLDGPFALAAPIGGTLLVTAVAATAGGSPASSSHRCPSTTTRRPPAQPVRRPCRRSAPTAPRSRRATASRTPTRSPTPMPCTRWNEARCGSLPTPPARPRTPSQRVDGPGDRLRLPVHVALSRARQRNLATGLEASAGPGHPRRPALRAIHPSADRYRAPLLCRRRRLRTGLLTGSLRVLLDMARPIMRHG